MLLRKTNLIVFITTFFCFFLQKSVAADCIATILPTQEASFCPGGSVLLTANTGTKLSYQWYRDDIELSGQRGATYRASVAGRYKVKVSSTATPSACTFAFSEEVNVTEGSLPAKPEFTFFPATAQCSGTRINFNVSDPVAGLTYTWDFGDDLIASGTSVSHLFYSQNLAGQDFSVTVTATNNIECDRTSQPQIVTVKPGPVINLTNTNNFRNCGGGTFNLIVSDDSRTEVGQIKSYEIDWGDGSAIYKSNAAPVNISHPYPVGARTLTYTLVSTNGCSVTKEFNVYNISNPAITVRGNGNTIACDRLNIDFPIEGFASNHPTTTYTVDFGDGSPKETYTHQQLLALPNLTLSHLYTKTSCGNKSGLSANTFRFLIVAANGCGTTEASVGGIRVYTKSIASFKLEREAACVGIETVFINTTKAGLNPECNSKTTYTWDFGDDSGESTEGRHTYKAPGRYIVTLKADNSCTPSSVIEIPIDVIPPPKGAFTTTINPANACIDATVRTTNLSSGNISGYTWSVYPSTNYQLAPDHTLTDKEPIFIFTKPGSYHLRLSTYNDCKNDTSSQKIVIKDIPTVTLPATQNYCGNEPPTLTFGSANAKHVPTYQEYNSAISAYLWEVEGGTYSFTSSTTAASKYPVIQFTSNATYTVKIIATNECGNSVSATQTIKVNYTGINTITLGQTSYCSDTPVELITGTVPPTGTSIIWQSHTKDDDFRMATGTADAANYNPGVLPEDTWFRRILRSGECDNISEIIKVTVSQPITNNLIFESQDLCARSTPELLTGSDPKGGNGQYMYIWESSTDNNIFKAVTGTNPNNLRDYQPGEIKDPTWFRRRVISGNCAESVSPAVRISVTPGVTENTIGTAQRICIGTTAAPLIGTNATGGNNTIKYLWEISFQSGSGGFEPAPNINDLKDYQPRDVTRDTWFRRTIISGGCKDISRAVKITVDKTIENNIISAAQTICTGTKPAVLSGTTHTGGNDNFTYEWEMSLDGIVYTTAPGVSNLKDFSPPALTQSTWYRRVIYSNPCLASESDPILIKVLLPITQNILTLDQTVCAGVIPETITGSDPKGSSGAYTYLWEMSREDKPESFGPAPGKNSEAAYTPPALTATTYYRRTVYAAPCQQVVSNSIKVQVNPLPPVPTTADAITCVGSPATLTASGTNVDFAWYTEATGGVPVLTGPTYITPPIMEKATYYVESQRAGCVSARVPVQVTTYNTVADAGEDVTIIKGNKIGLKASGGSKYTWTPASSLNNADVTNPIASPQETTTYRVIVETPEGCTSTDEITVTVIPRIIPANGITPNGDGANDTWVIKHIEHYPEAEIEIFNRWGNKIFTSIGYSTPWDGTFNGQPMPVAAYYFIIKLNKDEKPLSGNITLIR